MKPGIRASRGLAIGHFALILLLPLLVAFAPPAEGAILIVSLSNEDAGHIARWAVDHDARLLGAGPVPNSLVVAGSRAALARPALAHGGLLLTGAFAGCGKVRQ